MQFVASAPTLFPAEYVEEFQKCFDQAPAVPYDVIESILREELQRPLDSVYEYIDPVPIASASIAQVSLGTFLITLRILLFKHWDYSFSLLSRFMGLGWRALRKMWWLKF